MINIFLEMIKELSEKLFSKQTLIEGKERRYISSLIKNIIFLNDLKYYLEEFNKMWVEWKKDFTYYPQLPDIELNTNLSELLINIMKNFEKVRSLMIYDHVEAIDKLDFDIGGKINVFSIWFWIARKNAQCSFEYDRYKKFLYIPNYSYLIANTKPISKASREDIKIAEKFLADAGDYYESYYIGNEISSEYIPLLKNNRKIHYNNTDYYLKICIPDEMHYIDDIIRYTEDAMIRITNILNCCNNTLREYIGENKLDIIKYL